MANLTFADYISETLGFMNENRDKSSANRKIREDDVKTAINRGRHRMLRKVGAGLYRNTTAMNAEAGDLTPPADFFNEGIVHYTPTSSQKPRVLPVVTAKYMDQNTPNWRDETGEPSKIVTDLLTTGLVARLYPQPTATVTNGLDWYYSALLDDLVDDADTCPIMNLFPEFQMTTLQAGALRILYLLEGGQADEQFVKWDQIFEKDIDELRGMISRLFVSPTQLQGRN